MLHRNHTDERHDLRFVEVASCLAQHLWWKAIICLAELRDGVGQGERSPLRLRIARVRRVTGNAVDVDRRHPRLQREMAIALRAPAAPTALGSELAHKQTQTRCQVGTAAPQAGVGDQSQRPRECRRCGGDGTERPRRAVEERPERQARAPESCA